MEDPICVDTDIIIDYLRGRRPGAEVFEKVIRNGNPFTTYINRFELLCGAKGQREMDIINECLLGFTVLPFDDSSSKESARVFRELRDKGRLIGIRDIMIAGIALANGLVIATKNVREFERVKGLKVMSLERKEG